MDNDTGDPGSYDPFTTTEIAAASSATFNKTSKPFGSTAKRELNVNISGADTPGPGKYDAVRPEAATEASRSVFSSGTAQRPAVDATKVPAPGTYDVSIDAVKPDVTNAGNAMRGRGKRFDESVTSMTEDVGPGAYDSDLYNSLYTDAKAAMSRASKKKVPFGSSSQQRLVFYQPSVPGPGAYDGEKTQYVPDAGSVFKSE